MAYLQVFECQTNGAGSSVLPAIGSISNLSTLATFAPYGQIYQQMPINFGAQAISFDDSTDTVCLVPDPGNNAYVQFDNGSFMNVNAPVYIPASTWQSVQV